MEKVRRQIIYVDDVKYSLLSLKSRLREHYEVFPAQSAETLFEILENMIPDLILLDINMPETNGFGILEKLNDDPRFTDVPVIFLTSNYDKKTVIKAMSLGAADLVPKPYTDDELIKRIENQLDPDKIEAYKPVVLCVDDNPSILKSLNELLHKRYRVYTLPKPEALALILEKVEPDLFILDYKMPVLNGFELIPIIRAIPKHEKTPIIFLTSEGSVDNVSAAAYYGVSDFIVKPVRETVLREKLAKYISDYMMRRNLRKLADK